MKILQSLFLTLFFVSAFFSCDFVNQKKQKDSDEEKTSALLKEQKNLISDEITGSNVMLVVKDGK